MPRFLVAMRSRVQLQHEACALCVAFVQRQATVHADGHQGTDGQAQSVALRQVLDFAEGLEKFGALLFGDTAAGVRHDELVGVCAAFLEVERHLAAVGRVADSVLQQVQQDVFQLFRTNLDVQFRSVDRQGEVFLVRLLYFLHQPLAEGAHVLFLGLVGLGQRLLQVGKFLNVLRKASQGLYTRLAVVQRGQRRFHLRRYVLDELRLQLVVLVGQCDGFLLLAAQHKKAQQDDSHTNQS